MSVRQCQQEIDSQEFSEWMAFFSIDPFGEERADLRSSVIAATVANAHRASGARAYSPDDFMPKFDRAKKRQSAEEVMAVMMAVDAAQKRRRR